MPYVILTGYLLAPKIGVADISFMFLVFGFVLRCRNLAVSRATSQIVAIFSLTCLLVLLSAVVNQNLSPENVLKPIRNLLVILLLYSYIIRSQISLGTGLNIVVLAGAINSAVVLLQLVFSMLGWDDSVLRFYPQGETLGGLRKPGLSSGYPSSGMLCCIAATISLYRFYYTGSRKHFFALLLCLPGVFLSARTAVVFFIVAFSVVVGMALLARKVRFLVQVGSIFSLLIVMIGSLIALDPKIYDLFYIMFEFVFVYLDEGSVGVRSTDDLVENHYFVPEDLMGWLVGNGKGAWGDGGIQSDVWFVQNLMGSGFFVVCLYLLAFGCIWFRAFRAVNTQQRVIVSTVFFMVLISSFKGSFIFSRFVGDAATLIGICALSNAGPISSRRRVLRPLVN